MARKRPTVTEEEVQIARKGLLWGVPLCFALGALILVGGPRTIFDVPNEVRAGAPIVSIWPGTIIKFPFSILLLTCLVVIAFRAIPWPVAYIRAGKVAIWVMFVNLATMAFGLIGVPPLSSYYMSTHGYHRCEVVCLFVCKSPCDGRQGGGHGKRLISKIDLEPLGRANHDHEQA